MKKWSLLLVCLILCTFHVAAQKQQNDLSEMKIKGSVKLISEIEYVAVEKFGEIEKSTIIDSIIYIFNADGYLIEKDTYCIPRNSSKYLLAEKETYEFNGIGKLIKSSFFEIDEFTINGKLIDKKQKICIYDNQGLLSEISIYRGVGKLDRRTINKYDSKGKLIEKNHYEGDGSLDAKDKYVYDLQGKLIEINHYKGDGSLDVKDKYVYDLKGVKSTMSTYNSDGALISSRNFDPKGNAIQIMENNKIAQQYKYDINGNKIEYKYYQKDGRLDYVGSYKYDNFGNEIEEHVSFFANKSLNPDRISTNKYKFDNRNNWIEKCRKTEWREIFLTYRSIEYYNAK